MAQETFSSPLFHVPFTSKPYIPCHISLKASQLNKRCYKYIHTLEVTKELDLNPKTARIKSLRSLNMQRDLPYYFNIPIKISRIAKFIKPRQKYLKTLHGELKQHQLLRLIPRLQQVNLNYNDLTWRLFTTRFNFHHLSINFLDHKITPKSSQKPLPVEKLLGKCSTAFPRAISKQRNIQNLDITLHRGYREDTQIILNLLNKVDLSSLDLKHFHLQCLSTSRWLSQDPFPVSTGMKNAVGYIQKLSLQDTIWFISLFDGNVLKSLSALDISIWPSSKVSLDMLPTLRKIDTLREIKMTFQANSVENEEQFLEYFRLPNHIESVDLALVNFEWKTFALTKANRRQIQEEFDNGQRFTFFFNHWKELKQLKNFSLTLREELERIKRCPGLAGNFASRIIKQINSLKSVSYTHYLSPILPPKKKKRKPLPPPALPVKPLDLAEFWKALEPSRNILQNLTIDAPEVVFPVRMSSLNNNFPCLESISIGKKVLWAKDLNDFWNGFKTLKQIKTQELSFFDEKKFEIFLDSIRNIPKGWSLGCYSLDPANIKFEALKQCLTAFLKEADDVQREFKMPLLKLKVKNRHDLQQSRALFEDLPGPLKFQIQFFEDSISPSQTYYFYKEFYHEVKGLLRNKKCQFPLYIIFFLHN